MKDTSIQGRRKHINVERAEYTDNINDNVNAT